MDTTETPVTDPRPSHRLLRAFRAKERSGQAVVEFALVSVAFFSITLGTLDLGRGVFAYHQLSNAVSDGAHYGKIDPLKPHLPLYQAVIDSAPSLGLTTANIEVPVCTGGCYQGCADITVTAHKEFQPILSNILGLPSSLSSITLSATKTVETE